jgi:hypothetical protein
LQTFCAPDLPRLDGGLCRVEEGEPLLQRIFKRLAFDIPAHQQDASHRVAIIASPGHSRAAQKAFVGIYFYLPMRRSTLGLQPLRVKKKELLMQGLFERFSLQVPFEAVGKTTSCEIS